MTADSMRVMQGGEPATVAFQAHDKDGIQEQVVLLNELSRKLDEYFAIRTFGPEKE